MPTIYAEWAGGMWRHRPYSNAIGEKIKYMGSAVRLRLGKGLIPHLPSRRSWERFPKIWHARSKGRLRRV